MKHKVLSGTLALILLFCVVAPVQAHAEGNEAGWIELLEFSSVQDNGTNRFDIASTGSFSIPIHGSHRLRRVDILIWNPTDKRPNYASVTAGGQTLALDILTIGNNLTRVVGYIPYAWYTTLKVDFKKSSTDIQVYDVLSCKVTGVGMEEFPANAEVYVESYGASGFYNTNTAIPFYIENSNGYYSDGFPWLARVEVYDWEKFDSLSLWGYAESASIESVSCTLGNSALDFEMNYIDAESYEYAVDGDPTAWETAQWGTYFYNVTIDLSHVDRTLTSTPLYIYFTGSYDITVWSAFNCQYVNGTVDTADTVAVNWWTRFTTFMSGLLGGNKAESEQFQEEANEKVEELDGLNQELDSVTKPNVDNIDVSLESFVSDEDLALFGESFGMITGDSLIVTMLVMGLSVTLLAYILYGKR